VGALDKRDSNPSGSLSKDIGLVSCFSITERLQQDIYLIRINNNYYSYPYTLLGNKEYAV
jgi:hypothetical protein